MNHLGVKIRFTTMVNRSKCWYNFYYKYIFFQSKLKYSFSKNTTQIELFFTNLISILFEYCFCSFGLTQKNQKIKPLKKDFLKLRNISVIYPNSQTQFACALQDARLLCSNKGAFPCIYPCFSTILFKVL